MAVLDRILEVFSPGFGGLRFEFAQKSWRRRKCKQSSGDGAPKQQVSIVCLVEARPD